MTRVKLCGMTRRKDAVAAARAGADAIGLVFWKRSPRAVTPARARSILRALPASVAVVGVFVNEPPARVKRLVRELGLDAVQLHGDENPSDYASLDVPIIRAVHVTDRASLARARALPAWVTPLVDARDSVKRGGTGRVADWTWARRLARDRPIMLAGGLDSTNVARAIATVRPWAVDVSSGIERRPGIKDERAMTRLMRAMKRAGRGAR
jgi:phosphoribosylanthranilate isomerase